ncbi:hypothetical protein GWI33_011053 [Rhynchophorus ferrugineus]|nr:hypothetical protein GWI33_011053 [Rhynchophorus ferrugineus]
MCPGRAFWKQQSRRNDTRLDSASLHKYETKLGVAFVIFRGVGGIIYSRKVSVCVVPRFSVMNSGRSLMDAGYGWVKVTGLN